MKKFRLLLFALAAIFVVSSYSCGGGTEKQDATDSTKKEQVDTTKQAIPDSTDEEGANG